MPLTFAAGNAGFVANPTPIATGLSAVDTFVATLKTTAPHKGACTIAWEQSDTPGTVNVRVFHRTDARDPVLAEVGYVGEFSWIATGTE